MATPLSVLPNVLPYLEAFAEGSRRYAQVSHTKPEAVELIAGLCLRESWAGQADGYRPKGSPDGIGDWTARIGKWTLRPGVQVLEDIPVSRALLRQLGWSLPRRRRDDGALELIPGPYAIPADRKGWGRGLLQADVLGDHADLIQPPPWPVESQAVAACAQLALARKELEDLQAHPLFERAVVARYNAKLARVRAGLLAGNPDIGTTGGDYGKDVLALRDAVVARWPEHFAREGAA